MVGCAQPIVSMWSVSGQWVVIELSDVLSQWSVGGWYVVSDSNSDFIALNLYQQADTKAQLTVSG